MTSELIRLQPSALPCSRCGRRERTADDLYRLVLPDRWSFRDIRPWRERGLAIRQLVELGVRVERTCLACQSRAEGEP